MTGHGNASGSGGSGTGGTMMRGTGGAGPGTGGSMSGAGSGTGGSSMAGLGTGGAMSSGAWSGAGGTGTTTACVGSPLTVAKRVVRLTDYQLFNAYTALFGETAAATITTEDKPPLTEREFRRSGRRRHRRQLVRALRPARQLGDGAT